jgi:hypothetical protein
MKKPIQIKAESARKLSRVLMAKLGPPEGGSAGCDHWGTEYQFTWRYRHNDGSTWAKLGFGPTRKMVTLSRFEPKNGTPVFRMWIHLCKA